MGADVVDAAGCRSSVVVVVMGRMINAAIMLEEIRLMLMCRRRLLFDCVCVLACFVFGCLAVPCGYK